MELMTDTTLGRTRTRTDLMRAAGYKPQVVKSKIGDTFSSPGFRALCEANGMTGESIRKVVDDALQAKTVVTFQGDAKETEAPDHAIRLRAAEYLGKITGLQVERSQVVSVNVPPDEALNALGLG